MTDKPLVSVLLPLYNEPVKIAMEAIYSICNQTYRHLEIFLLLDNPNNKELLDLLQMVTTNDTRITLIVNEKNIGLPQTLNKGIDLATGEYIARMDADDISMPERIENQLVYLLKHPEIHLVGCDAFIIDEDGIQTGYYSKLRTDFSHKIFLRHCASSLIHPTWMGTIELFKRCKYRDFLSGQDYDFLLRAYAYGFNFHNLKKGLLKYRIPKHSLRSISCSHAYEQYVNAKLAKEQFLEFKRTGKFSPLPRLRYDLEDKEKYMAGIPLLNQLRESFLKKQYVLSFKLTCQIIRVDKRLIMGRMKSNLFAKGLSLLELFSKQWEKY
ncbi:glycosyltransferase [Parabacteroides goldsteinii]|uniref:glycosyltransferase n=1 Tax=Parabacteroides goldsteinii TaxID=328812 RepID=UPI002673B99A|nr:glycosyltransferase [Parabacteroides goldsteinii]